MEDHAHGLCFMVIFIIFSNLHLSKSSNCTLDFKQFPYEEHGDCFNIGMVAKPAQPEGLCCQLGLQNMFMAMAITANVSRTIFLDTIQALECNAVFQGLHTRTNLSTCKFQDFISSSTCSKCSTDVNAIVGLLGIERFGDLRSSCENISKNRSSDEGCFNCLVSYRRSLQALEDANGREGSTPGRSVCAEALLVSLASSEVASKEWVQGLFSCLWGEIIAVTEKSMEDDRSNSFSFSGLYIFSRSEIARATGNFNVTNVIGEGSKGKVYLGIMPSGQKVAVKRLHDDMKLQNFAMEISKLARIRHPNVVSVLGYCDRGEQCLVYEFCVNGNLESWLLGDSKLQVLTWEQRLRIAICVAQGLWFLQNNPFEEIKHGDIKLTNILLNERLEAKLSDSVLSSNRPTKGERKTDGYFKDEFITQPSEVYSFGVFLLQLLTGTVVDFVDSRPCLLVTEVSFKEP
ncbi:proline-rich receptor-like protein kinase PERK15 [Cinnamomum micranthum f. kanehirae]|uniref:Proline-rich receptor-like protein kinase PERK15 n=1 Tax=Cinnamomum micranthum f. kanehirae TaxID=337451 RepID=A0A3S3MFJ9_9MAGN|nr:proline-rich receptor-like protein kinase PERK15 [Cinnamomum micranthum f. kanehirae]